MSRPYISDSNFNEVHGSLVHEEDKSQTFHYDASRYYTKSSGPQVYMPYQGHPGSPPGQGSVNIGVASGNVNTGPVHGSLHQTGGIRRTAAPRPTYPPTGVPMLASHVPRRQRQLAYTMDGHPFHDEPQSAPQYHGHEVAPAPHRHYPYQQEEYSDEEDYRADYQPQDRHPTDFPHPPAQYFESPTRDRHINPPRDNRSREYSREDHSQRHARQHNTGYPLAPSQAPRVKDRNPFRNGTVPLAPASEAPRPGHQPRAATTDYTKDWVASSASPSTQSSSHRCERPPPLNPVYSDYDRRSDVRLSVRSPSLSEDTRSSSGSSGSPVYWGSPPSSSSYATTPNRYSPVQEEREDYLHAKKSHSRSSSPGLC
ncbi:hypothetical protein BKA70DRAFT_1269061 [Coprinopsis sp. MPI-PUGE-AT-0042]|nr:hypothetical protein BKA70DRAFT_1269061 [Coprinopsis sp. MPI-PUGE-AT-0042]